MDKIKLGNPQFTQNEDITYERSQFKRTYKHKTTGNHGQLIPFYIDEALPGDIKNIACTVFARMATPIYPLMDNLRVETFFFFVPNRLVWENWDDFITGKNEALQIPQIKITEASKTTTSLAQYFGIPVWNVDFSLETTEVKVNALPFRAYNLIYNEWFRNQDTREEIEIAIDNADIEDLANNYVECLKPAKTRDYFTTAMSEPLNLIDGQYPQIDLNLAFGSNEIGDSYIRNIFLWGDEASGTVAQNVGKVGSFDGSLVTDLSGTPPDGELGINLSKLNFGFENAGFTINDFRQTMAIQGVLEADKRFGQRYNEFLYGQWGIMGADARLQIPEYLDGGVTYMEMTSVPNTTGQDENKPQGTLGAFGKTVGTCYVNKTCEEYGYIIGLLCVRGDINYQQGLHRMWSRRLRFDHHMPILNNLGEQAILSKELYYNGDKTEQDGVIPDEDIFGYQERHSEYNFKPNNITGEFNSLTPTPLDAWHIAQKFATRPQLNNDFIEENAPIDRVIAVTNQANYIFDIYMEMNEIRHMPVKQTPILLKKF